MSSSIYSLLPKTDCATTKCIWCSKYVDKSTMIVIPNGGVCCSGECHDECIDDGMLFLCEVCGESCYTDDINFIDQVVYCDNCCPKCPFCLCFLNDEQEENDDMCTECHVKSYDAYESAKLAFFVGVSRHIPQPDMMRQLADEFPDVRTYIESLDASSKFKKL